MTTDRECRDCRAPVTEPGPSYCSNCRILRGRHHDAMTAVRAVDDEDLRWVLLDYVLRGLRAIEEASPACSEALAAVA